MKKIRFTDHVLPHIVAVGVFLIVTVLFFSPVFFEGKIIQQNDIEEFQGSAKAIVDFREKHDEEPLWTNAMFGGMPAYLISVQWSNKPVVFCKQLLALFLPHPVANIFCAFIAFYIMLLCFRVRPYLAIAGALAYGLSSYLIIGLSAGHNGRIGAIAFMPLVMGGIHLCFSGRKLLGAAVTALGMALHLRENHLQITYYLMFIVALYGLVQLIDAVREKTLGDLAKTIGILLISVVIGAGTFFGQFWAVTEYSAYSTRGKSELTATGNSGEGQSAGMSKEYAFEFSNGILEPLTLMIPNVYGGSSFNFLVQDQNSATYKALVSSGNQQTANQLANYTSAYWGGQRLSAPYYIGAIIVFLFAVGIAFADKKYVWWLTGISLFGIILTWGSNFSAFNYFMFDYFPGYNKFRSVTFAILLPIFAMPLLGLLGLENLWKKPFDKSAKKKLLIAFASTGGLCLFFTIIPGVFDLMKDQESQLPPWFINALIEDRKDLLRSDAFRSFAFIAAAFVILYFDVHRKISTTGVVAFLVFMICVDHVVVDKRYFNKDNFKRKRDNNKFAINGADQVILRDKEHFRVYNLANPFAEARTSYHHNSIGGYHGAKMRRYAEFYDSCLFVQTQKFIAGANEGNMSFSDLPAFNMLNIKYIVYGNEAGNVIPNRNINGNAWFVRDLVKVNSPNEELSATCEVDSKTTAVIDVSRFPVNNISADSTGRISLSSYALNKLVYETQSASDGIAVFSEIYYPKGWIATIDGKETTILRANYILRALEIPAGKHTIEFRFEPKAYVVGNKVTMIFSWLTIILVVGSIVVCLRKENNIDGTVPKP